MTGGAATERDAATAFARALVDEWGRAGVVLATLAPGSRSAPLALALAGASFPLHVHLDERSAAYFALGAAKATGRPAVVLCTSGTAAANFHPAVLEAHHARVPLIVCTADRPPELRDVGAGQTVDQLHLYGSAVRWFVEAEVPADRPGAPAAWRQLAARAVAAASGPPAGPVHLDLPFREPLVPSGKPEVEAPGRPDGRPWTVTAPVTRAPDGATAARLTETVRNASRGLLVAGWGADVAPRTASRFADAARWPVLADPLSDLRSGPHAISTYDGLLRVTAFARDHRPDLVVRIGAPLTSKVATTWLDPAVPQVLVDPNGAWSDPAHGVSERLPVDAELLLDALAGGLGTSPAARTDWLDGWLAAEDTARRALDSWLDARSEPFEGRVARDVVAAVPNGTTIVVGSSMPVRDVEAFVAPRTGVRYLANRGVNGIDGLVSTALGVAATTGPVVALLGDLCLLHDANGLVGAGDRRLDATFVVVDNDGGGIFSLLPQADLPEHFEALFGTPHGLDLAGLASLHGLPVTEIEKAADVEPAVRSSVDAGGVHLVLVRTDRTENATRHREAWEIVASSIGR